MFSFDMVSDDKILYVSRVLRGFFRFLIISTIIAEIREVNQTSFVFEDSVFYTSWPGAKTYSNWTNKH